MFHPERIVIEIEFVLAAVPDDENAADRYADDVGDRIAAKIDELDDVAAGSVSVQDWTSRRS